MSAASKACQQLVKHAKRLLIKLLSCPNPIKVYITEGNLPASSMAQKREEGNKGIRAINMPCCIF